MISNKKTTGNSVVNFFVLFLFQGLCGSTASFARFLIFFLGSCFCSQLLAFLEPLNVSTSIEQFLLTGVERVAVAADFSINRFNCGASGELVSA